MPASIVKAGLRPRLVDVDPDTLDFDRAALDAADTSRVLAIVATNLYGMPNDLPRLVAFGRARGVFVVDDAAQAMGATSSGRPAGTWGDAGLYSLDKGKNVSAIDGGVLVTSDDRVADALRAEIATLGGPTLARRAEHVAKALVYATLLQPRLYWMPNAIPQLGLGRTVFTTEFAIEQQDPRARRARRRDAAASSPPSRRRGAPTPRASLDGHRPRRAACTCRPSRRTRKPAWLRLPLLVDGARLARQAGRRAERRRHRRDDVVSGGARRRAGAAAVAGRRRRRLPGRPHRGEPHPHAADAPVRVGGGHRAPSPPSCASVVDADPVPAAMGAATR